MGFFDFFKIFSDNSVPKTNLIDQSILDSIPSNCVMIIDDIFSISGKGIVVTGTILRDSVRLNDTLMVMETGKIARVVGIESFRKQLDVVSAGDNVGIFLADVTRDDLMKSYKLLKI